MPLHILGIRHHGPGSARNVQQRLHELQPDIILVEGPPEADNILAVAADAAFRPPVAILCYNPDQLQQSVFYPFAEFSAEWQAIQYGVQHKIPVRFFDLPIGMQLAAEQQHAAETDDVKVPLPEEQHAITTDPIATLAAAAGNSDGEEWWEQMFEHRRNGEQVFEAVMEAMQELRSHFPNAHNRLEQLREAYMRRMIRQAEREMFTTIAVVCGAWHAPALLQPVKQKDDNELLKGLAKVKVECTWIPWTYRRLSTDSGYGAGITSPGWYHYVWHHAEDNGVRWLANVAQLFRAQGMDTSTAHVMEAVRLAATLAAMRDKSKPGLAELNEATISVLCQGDTMLMDLIANELIISNTLGAVPESVPRPPLQTDIEKYQKRLRLPQTADAKEYTLDLRKENDLERSVLLHRLSLLGIHWGQQLYVQGKGSFKEQWRLQWEPSLAVDIIEKGVWGNTVASAADSWVVHAASKAGSLPALASLMEQALPAELPQAFTHIAQQIKGMAAAGSDVLQLMEAIPPLVNIMRYGNVRNTDTTMVQPVLQEMVTRVLVSLPVAVTAINEDAAIELQQQLRQLNEALQLLQQKELKADWLIVLQQIAYNETAAPLISGYALRLLADAQAIERETLIAAFSKRVSTANAPAVIAAWLEGFLKGSGTLLLIDEALWSLVSNWVSMLPEEVFMTVLPLLRRTFGEYTAAERKKLGAKAKGGMSMSVTSSLTTDDFDEAAALTGLPVVWQLLALQKAEL